MNFNTAILYDIENLIGGYGKAELLSNLSLKDIFEEIQKKEIGKIAIQRAYANWSDPRLSILRGDVVELGMEPIQMFGFGRGPQKNASDIQLAIDAVDIAFTRKAIEIFIIVSGDGGFSSLAKRLHEYGYMVIGCAYRRTTNRVFSAVCDDFVWIDEPKDDFTQTHRTSEFSDPILRSYAEKHKPVSPPREQILAEATRILDSLADNTNASYLLRNVGLNISIFSQALSYRIENFDYILLGFTGFIDFIRYVSNNSKVKLVYSPPSEYRLLLNNSSIRDFEEVESLTEIGDIHTLENYRILLGKKSPTFHLPSSEIMYSIAQYLADNRENYKDVMLGDVIDRISSEFPYEQKEIRACVTSYVHSGCFTREPAEASLSEQKLSFLPLTAEQAVNTLKEAVHQKLEELLERVEEDTFTDLFI